MKRTKLFLFFVLLMTSCDMVEAPPTPTPTPTATFTPRPTATHTPTLTPTTTPSPTPTQIGGGSGRLIFRNYKDSFINAFPDLQGESHVFVANLDGSDLIPITMGLESENYLSDISPDSTRALIVSYSHYQAQYATLYMVNLKSLDSGPILLVDKVSHQSFSAPTAMWIDNSQIVYIGQGDSGFGIYKMNVDDNHITTVMGNETGIVPFRLRGVNSTRVFWDIEVLQKQLSANAFVYNYKIYWTSLVDGETQPLKFNGDIVAVKNSVFGNTFVLSPDGLKIAWVPDNFMSDTFDKNIDSASLFL